MLKLVLGLVVFVLLGLRLVLDIRNYQPSWNVPMPLMVLVDKFLPEATDRSIDIIHGVKYHYECKIKGTTVVLTDKAKPNRPRLCCVPPRRLRAQTLPDRW